MARVHGKDSRVLVNSAHLSGSISGWRFEHRRALSDVTNLLSDGDQFIPGLLSGSVNIAGLFDSAAGNIQATIDAAAAATDGLLTTFAPEGLTIGRFAFISSGNVATRDTPTTVTDAVKITVDGTANDGVDIGFILHALSAETADGQSTSVDNGAASTGGAVASLHVTAFSGFSSVLLRAQHSTDNSAWSDLLSFTSVAGTTSERKTVTGTVNRYTRAWFDVTGSGSITFVMALARR